MLPMRLACGGLVLVALLGCSSKNEAAGGGVDRAAQLCLDTVNGYRATMKLAPYTLWTDALACSDGEALSDSQSMKAHGAFGTCGEHAQNECPNWPGPPEQLIPKCLAMMWAEGPGSDFSKHGHYLNMSSASYTQIACGFSNRDGATIWAVQNFR